MDRFEQMGMGFGVSLQVDHPDIPPDEQVVHHQQVESRGNIVDRTGLHTADGGFVELGIDDLGDMEFVGEGNCAHVMKAHCAKLGKTVAVKILTVSHYDDMASELAGLVGHHCPEVIPFHGAFLHEGALHLVIAFMDLGNLEEVIAMDPLPEELLQWVALTVAKGLCFLHHERHVIHRDLKPANLLLNSEGELLITDFSVGRSLEASGGSANTFVGTVGYMAPERLVGKKYDNRVDIWSLGIILLECCMQGVSPFGADMGYFDLINYIMKGPAPKPPAELQGLYSEDFSQFVSCCLVTDPAKRLSAQELLEHPWLKDFATTGIYSEDFREVKQEWMEDLTRKLRMKRSCEEVSDQQRQTHAAAVVSELSKSGGP